MQKFFLLALFALTFPSMAAADIIDADRRTLDDIMYLPRDAAANWVPQTFLDIRYPWPEKYIERFRQPFNPHMFKRNASALRQYAEKSSDNATIVLRQAEYLDFVASHYIVQDGQCSYVTNEFDYGYIGLTFQNGFRGAFMSNHTAYGYIDLYEATGNKAYLETAYALLRSSAFCETDEVFLHWEDEEGYLWLNEYVFKITPEEEARAKLIGMTPGPDGWFRAEVFNGHISALIAYIRYEQVTGTKEFDEVIRRSIATAERYLPDQIFEDRYFAYMNHFYLWPDYGQERAVRLAQGLCEISPSESLCATAQRMEALFETKIKGHEQQILTENRAVGKETLNRQLSQN